MICRRVADAVVDLAQQHLALGGERGVAVARGVDFGLGVVAGLAEPWPAAARRRRRPGAAG